MNKPQLQVSTKLNWGGGGTNKQTNLSKSHFNLQQSILIANIFMIINILLFVQMLFTSQLLSLSEFSKRGSHTGKAEIAEVATKKKTPQVTCTSAISYNHPPGQIKILLPHKINTHL